MNAAHFRHRAQRAREMAEVGDDPRLVELLLEVAADMEAEANAIERADAQAAKQPSDVAA